MTLGAADDVSLKEARVQLSEHQTVIKASLKEKNLDEYDAFQRFGIKLLNFVTALFSPIK